MAVRANYIFPECYVDTNILKTLLNVDGVNHQYGCSRVMAGMETGRFADGFAIVNALRSSSEMARLERIISYLHDKQYAAIAEDLVAVFYRDKKD